ncbi:MAG TPA: DUF5684 domain-containing protein [Candidatus Saccharimonadales bacterium]|nr:DUF5684 domain-containing protein [Candidatus Saccharimonadales bacterium]
MYFAQSVTNYYTQTPSTSGGSATGILIAYLVVLVIFLVAGWRIFEKAGQAGWKIIIPIYNAVIQLRIAGMSGWFVLLYLVPIVNFFFAIYVAYRMAKAFGYGVGMTILEILLIGYLILAFGKAKYVGHGGKGSAPAGGTPATQPA